MSKAESAGKVRENNYSNDNNVDKERRVVRIWEKTKLVSL